MVGNHRWVGLLGLLLLAGCGPSPEEAAWSAYMESREAIEAGDLERLRSLLASEQGEPFAGPGAALALEFAKAALPREIQLVESSVGGGKATLQLTGLSIMDEGERKTAMPGEAIVELVLEDGEWKIAKEEWSFQMELAYPIFDVQPFMKEGQRPVARKILEGHAGPPTQIVYTRNWRFLITISYGDFSLRVWDVDSGEEISSETFANRPTSVAVSSDGQTVVTGGVDGTILRRSLDAFGLLGAPEAILWDVGRHAEVSPDGKWLAATSDGEPVHVYDLSTLNRVASLESSEPLRTTTFSPSGRLLAGSEGNEILLWDTKTWSSKSYTVDGVDPQSNNGRVTFSQDGRYLGVPCGDSSIVVFDVERRRVEHDFFVSGVAALGIEFAPDGSLFATAQNNQIINVWSMEDHRRVGYILSKKANASALAFSPDGRHLIAGHDDRQLVFWGVAAKGEAPVVARAKPRAAAAPPTSGRSQTPERVRLLSKTNLLENPNGTQHEQFWRTSGDVSIEECDPGNPCFVTRWDGEFKGTARLPANAQGRYLLLIGTAASERVNPEGWDQTGAAYISGFGAPDSYENALGEHYTADTLKTDIREDHGWTTIWGVFQVGDAIRTVDFKIRQADGRSAKDGSAARFDDLGVFLFDSEAQAKAFVPRYERRPGRVAAALSSATQQAVPAVPAPAASEPPASSEGSAITSCQVGGRLVFMTQAQCAAQRSSGRR